MIPCNFPNAIKLPENDPNMGFTGIHYNLHLNDWFYSGLGIYGAVSGNKGGFFTLGLNFLLVLKNLKVFIQEQILTLVNMKNMQEKNFNSLTLREIKIMFPML